MMQTGQSQATDTFRTKSCMRKTTFLIFLGALAQWAPSAALSQETIQLARKDRVVVSMTAYAPRGRICRGVAIISPGAGGSEQGYRYLGEAMSSLGYFAVVIGHPESGRRALREHVRGNGLREGLAELITDPEAYRGRFMDIAVSRQWTKGRCEASESLLIGHSMGAATVMMEAGARNKLGIQGADAFSAYIALSPQGAGLIFPDNAWSGITKPVLLLTGTHDNELGGASWETRTEPFKNMPKGCKWLGVIEGASHLNFAGNGMSRKTETLTSQVIGAFLDGLHRGDCRSATRLQGVDLATN
jgi:predicted dienelactone hydrolase